jgi:hypothetical protein
MKMLRLTLMLILVALVVGCSSSSTPQQQVVRLTISTKGIIPAGQSLAGIGMTMTLPAGVTPALDASGQVDTVRLVTPSGVTGDGGLATTAIYLEAAAGQPARLALAVSSMTDSGFGIGECMILTLNRTAGTTYQANEFDITEFSAANLDGVSVGGMQAVITDVKLQ